MAMQMRRSKGILLAISILWIAACGGGLGDPTARVTPNTTTPGLETPTGNVPTFTVTRTDPPTSPTVTRPPTSPTVTRPPTSPTVTRPPTSPTVTRAPGTPTVTATFRASNSVEGLIIVRSAFAESGASDLGTPPASWQGSAPARPSDKALSFAEWQLDGAHSDSGVTAGDGTVDLGSLPSGEYRLDLRKAINGNLMETSIEFQVGAEQTQFIVELEQGRVRTHSRFRDGGVEVRRIQGPDGSRLVERDGKLVELAAANRELIDADGDGSFEPNSCAGNVWPCDDAAACGENHICQCSSSCPGCEDCGQRVCAPRAAVPPYRCNANGGCQLPGDRCVCVASCPDCDDCSASVCLPGCAPVEITGLTIEAQTQVVIGRSATLRAIATLDDGSAMDVTYLVDWLSSDETVATVDGWGTLTAAALGTTQLRAVLGELQSDAFPLTVVERPRLDRLVAQIAPCYYPWGRPNAGPGGFDDSLPADAFPHPFCNDTVRIGQAMPLSAWAFYADGQVEDVGRLVAWEVEPNEVGDVVDVVFTGTSAGSASIRASLGGVESEALSIKVVTEPTLVQLSIYPTYGPLPPPLFPIFEDDPKPSDAPAPCFECGYDLTVLIGDRVPYVATARYDTGEWQDVTDRVGWRSNATATASFDATGVMTAAAAGEATVDATYQGQTSNPVRVHVVATATLLDIYIYPEGNDRVVEKGGEAFFAANGSYDVGFARSLTDEARWHSSNDAIGGFDAAGVFTGRAAGQVQVWAELDGKQSNLLPMSVFERSDLSYCDEAAINRAVWSDAFNRVTLESDCRQYTAPGSVELRFTVTERERPAGIFDPCLDLYVYDGDRKLRTIREQGCGEPFLAPSAPGFEDEVVRFQHKAFWDLRDDHGQLVPPGEYTVFGRFYLYYDPIIRIPLTVVGE